MKRLEVEVGFSVDSYRVDYDNLIIVWLCVKYVIIESMEALMAY